MTTALTITMTRAGLARFTAAQLGDGIDLAIASVALTDADFVVAPTLEVLPGEFRRIAMISGRAVGDNVVHLTMRDDDPVGYTARGFGLFLADGTLFAVYGQAGRLFEKSPLTTFLAAIDIAFPTAAIDRLTFGNTDFLNPPATTAVKGVVELATQAEADIGTDARRVPPVSVMRASIASAIAAVSAALDARFATLSAALIEALDGLASRTVYGSGLVKGGGRNDVNRTLTVDAATGAQVRAGTAPDVAVTPQALAGLAEGFPQTGEYSPVPGVYHKIGYVPGPLSEGAASFDFVTPFPTACLIVLPVGINGSGSNVRDIYMQEQSISRTGAVGYVQKAGSDGSTIDGFRYLAIGY